MPVQGDEFNEFGRRHACGLMMKGMSFPAGHIPVIRNEQIERFTNNGEILWRRPQFLAEKLIGNVSANRQILVERLGRQTPEFGSLSAMPEMGDVFSPEQPPQISGDGGSPAFWYVDVNDLAMLRQLGFPLRSPLAIFFPAAPIQASVLPKMDSVSTAGASPPLGTKGTVCLLGRRAQC